MNSILPDGSDDKTSPSPETDDYCHCPAKIVPHRHLGPIAPGPDAGIVQAIVGLPMRLKAHRAAHNLSQREIAKRTGMSFATVCRIESGEDYVVSNLIALASYLDSGR